MRALTPIVFILLIVAALPRDAKAGDAANAGDAEGCADLKLFPRLESCVIVECSAKQHDSVEAADGSGFPQDANTNSISYACPVAAARQIKRDIDAQLRKAGYQSVAADQGDATNPSLTARKNSQWIYWNASIEDSAITYSLTTASADEKLKAETCALPPVLSTLRQCEILECNSKSEDSVAMRTAQKGETSLAGNVQTVTLACPSISPAQAFSSMEKELRTSGFEILFSDREQPGSGWVTGRAGKRWVELASAPDGESITYALTVVPSAEVLRAPNPELKETKETNTAAPAPEPILVPAPKPVQAEPVQAVSIPEPVLKEPAAAPIAATAAAAQVPVFIPPKPILEAPIEAAPDLIGGIRGDVVIDMLVDVSEQGTVTKAELTGKITKNVLKLKSAALEAVLHWRFEPARQDGRVVAAVKIDVRMHFHGRPWLF